jgi:CubicO group peptidase (beta-lactamase class C family)
MKKVLLVILLLPLLWYSLPKQKIISDDIDNIAEYIPAVMQEAAIPGLAVAKVSGGKVTFLQAYGKANIESNELVTESTLFNIASISKPIMGVVLLQLVEQGKLELDRNINDYLPFKLDNPHLDNEKITLRHLVTHTSSLADYYDVDSYAINQDSSVSLEQHLKSLLTPSGEQYNNGQYFLENAPGTKRKYSNLAATLAGYLVEATTGITLAEYSKKHLFKPLAMENTSWLLHDLSLENIAVPYEVEQCIPVIAICSDTESMELNSVISKYFNPPSENKRFIPYPHFGNPQYPDGGIRSSIKDLSQLLVGLLKNRDASANKILSESMHEEMLKLQLPEDISDSQRFFWRDNSMGLIGHMGSDLGVFTALYFDPLNKTGFIIVMNRGMDSNSAVAMKKIANKLVEMY